MEGIGHIAKIAAETGSFDCDLLELRRSPRFDAAGGLAVLLVIVTLSTYKPRGMTRYGWRKPQERTAPSAPHGVEANAPGDSTGASAPHPGPLRPIGSATCGERVWQYGYIT